MLHYYQFFVCADSVPARDEQKCLIDSFHAAMCFGPSVIFLDGMDQFTSSPQFSVKEVGLLFSAPTIYCVGGRKSPSVMRFFYVAIILSDFSI